MQLLSVCPDPPEKNTPRSSLPRYMNRIKNCHVACHSAPSARGALAWPTASPPPDLQPRSPAGEAQQCKLLARAKTSSYVKDTLQPGQKERGCSAARPLHASLAASSAKGKSCNPALSQALGTASFFEGWPAPAPKIKDESHSLENGQNPIIA